MQEAFAEYDLDVSEIDMIPTCFADLDVSARTDHGIVYLNYTLLCDGDFFKDYSYLVHEYSHVAQQTTGNKATKGADDGIYLDNPHEIEGFQNQIEWIAETFGDNDADKYVDKMLNHHEMKGKKKEEKKQELKAKIDDE